MEGGAGAVGGEARGRHAAAAAAAAADGVGARQAGGGGGGRARLAGEHLEFLDGQVDGQVALLEGVGEGGRGRGRGLASRHFVEEEGRVVTGRAREKRCD